MTENHETVAPTSKARPSSRFMTLPFHSNPDIIDEICEHLAYDDIPFQEDDYHPFLQTFEIDIRSSRQALRDAALTCKAFLEPALNRLWRSLDTLFPLLKTLPVFVLSDTTYVIRGKMEEKDWERFDFYARRIRRFKYTRDPEQLDIAMHVYFRLAQLRPNPLLPSLRHLICPSIKQKDYLVPGIFLFLGPAIQTMELRGISSIEDKLTGTVLHTLLAEDARLGTLTLNGHGLSKDTIVLATKFRHVQTLEIRGVHPKMDIEVIKNIASLPWLSDLKIDLEGPGITSDTFSGHEDIGLRDLKRLRVSGPVDTIRGFMSSLSTSSLEDLKIAITIPQHGLFQQHILEAALTQIVQCWDTTLTKVAIVQQRFNDRDMPLQQIAIYALLPLTHANALTYFRLEGFTLELTDEDLYSLLEGWPLLEHLTLPSSPPTTSSFIPEIPTLASLHRISFLCPQLTFLCMPLSFERVEVPPGPNPWQPHGLRTFIIAGSGEMEDPIPQQPVAQPAAGAAPPANQAGQLQQMQQQQQQALLFGFNPPPIQPQPPAGAANNNVGNGGAGGGGAPPAPAPGPNPAPPGAGLLFAQAAVMPAAPAPLGGAPPVVATRTQWDLQDLLLVARHIDKAFPCVKWIEGSESRNRDRWRQVRDVVNVYHELREDAMQQMKHMMDMGTKIPNGLGSGSLY